MKAVLFVIVGVMSLNCHAGRLQAKCLLAEKSDEVTGQNENQRLPIASVSKIFTSLWAVSSRKIDSNYETKFYVTPAGSDTFDVHIAGAMDPYFSEQSLHYLISQLNKLNVFKIRNLTFDENFKFYFNPNGRNTIPGARGTLNVVDSQRPIADPSPELVKRILSNKKLWLLNYNKTLAKYPDELVKKPKLYLQTLDYLPSSQFPSIRKATDKIKSADLITQLKMMNWNSNNHAANMFFLSLGSKIAFDKFMTERLKFTSKDYDFHNGSGNNENFNGGAGVYNSATCATVVKAVKLLKYKLEEKKQNLEDVLAVAGADQGATIQRYSLNVHSGDAVIAKSGTISSNVALAGMISTAKGKYFFAYNFATSPLPKMRNPTRARIEAAMRAEWTKTRAQIGVELGKLVASLGGAKSIGYKAKAFKLESFEDTEDEQISESEIDKQIIAADAGSDELPNVL